MKFYYLHQFMLKFKWLCLIQLTLLIMAVLLKMKTEASKLVIVSNINETNTTATPQGPYWAKRSTPPQLITTNDTYQCDYYASYCLRAYNTSMVCGRTMMWQYHDFPNYCILDYVNCVERYEMWQVAYMGHCFYLWPKPYLTYTRYTVYDDKFLDQFYLEDEWNLETMFG